MVVRVDTYFCQVLPPTACQFLLIGERERAARFNMFSCLVFPDLRFYAGHVVIGERERVVQLALMYAVMFYVCVTFSYLSGRRRAAHTVMFLNMRYMPAMHHAVKCQAITRSVNAFMQAASSLRPLRGVVWGHAALISWIAPARQKCTAFTY